MIILIIKFNYKWSLLIKIKFKNLQNKYFNELLKNMTSFSIIFAALNIGDLCDIFMSLKYRRFWQYFNEFNTRMILAIFLGA